MLSVPSRAPIVCPATGASSSWTLPAVAASRTRRPAVGELVLISITSAPATDGRRSKRERPRTAARCPPAVLARCGRQPPPEIVDRRGGMGLLVRIDADRHHLSCPFLAETSEADFLTDISQ